MTIQGQGIGTLGDRTQSDGIIGQDAILQLAKSSSALVLKRKFSRKLRDRGKSYHNVQYSTGKQIRKFVMINPQIPSPQIPLVSQSANRKSAKLQEKSGVFLSRSSLVCL